MSQTIVVQDQNLMHTEILISAVIEDFLLTKNSRQTVDGAQGAHAALKRSFKVGVVLRCVLCDRALGAVGPLFCRRASVNTSYGDKKKGITKRRCAI